jgi:hypothetical protein
VPQDGPCHRQCGLRMEDGKNRRFCDRVKIDFSEFPAIDGILIE